MDFGRIVKWLIVIAVVVIGWKIVVPWIKGQTSDAGKSASSADTECVRSAERASQTWGSGLGRFVNPPYDIEAWSQFRGDVDDGIGRAEAPCSCAEESCTKTREAMRDLRGLVGEFDTSIRNGSSPPDDAVQRQESIDNRISRADELRREGK